MKDKTPPPTAARAGTGLARSSNAFGLDLYRRLRDKPGNLIVSPASLTTALTLAWTGAKGETAEQMRRVLHLEGSVDEVRGEVGKLTQWLESPEHSVTFRIANRLFGDQSYPLQADYQAKTKAAFGAGLEALDFRHAAEAARRHINGWVEEQTEKKIRELIPGGGVDDQTRLVLVNAIYFLGDWQSPFEHGTTRAAPFHLAGGGTKSVPTMRQSGGFRIAARDGVTALEMPYEGGSFSMVVLLPDAPGGLPALEGALDTARVDALLGGLKRELVSVALPKFTIDPSQAMSLGGDLIALGMPRAFDRDHADFTGIANPPHPADRLVIAKVFHKGFIRVDEEGTEAAAASAVTMMRAGSAATRPREFNADHPFLFLIRDNLTGLVVFLGRVNDPSAG